MFALSPLLYENWLVLLANPFSLAITVFQIWMFIHAVRNREWIWAVLIFVGWGLTSFWYYLMVYRSSVSSVSGFELPGAQSRKRIRELQAQIHHIGNALHYFQLGDVYFQKGQFAEAEKCYREALQREPNDIDVRAHLGQCLVRLKRAAAPKSRNTI